jgi:hypothetical protein
MPTGVLFSAALLSYGARQTTWHDQQPPADLVARVALRSLGGPHVSHDQCTLRYLVATEPLLSSYPIVHQLARYLRRCAAMMNDQARVSLVAQGTGALACELCTAEANVPTATVVVHHSRGGIVQLAACDWCVQALRRLAATTGGHAVFALAEGGIPAPGSRRPTSRGARPAGPPVMILEFFEHLRDPVDGATYVARVYGRPRMDGTWEGWLEFVAVGAAVVLRTEQETTQSNRQGVAYWASGLEPSYLEGAFARARRESLPAVAV